MRRFPLATLLTLWMLTASDVHASAGLRQQIDEAHILLEETWGNGPTRALEQLEDALQIAQSTRNAEAEAAARVGLGRLRARGADGVGALAHLELAQEFYASTHRRTAVAGTSGAALALGFGEAYRALGELAAARESLERAQELAQRVDVGAWLVAAAHLVQADLDELEGAFDGALVHLEAAAAGWRALGETRRAKQSGLERAKLYHRLGHFREARAILEELTKTPPTAADRAAIRAYLDALLQPSDAFTSIAETLFAAASGREPALTEEGTATLGGTKLSFGLKLPTTFTDADYMTRRRQIVQRRRAALANVPEAEPRTTRQYPLSSTIEERLVHDCAELHRRHAADNDAIVDWLIENVPGYTWQRNCNREFHSSGGRLPADCQPSVLAFQASLWEVDSPWLLECGAPRKGFSVDAVRDLYSDFGIDEELILSGSGFRKPDFRADPMPEPFASMFTARNSGNPFEAYFNAVDRKHGPVLAVLYDLSLEFETWSALGRVRQNLRRPAREVAAAYEKAWHASEPIWSALPKRMGFSASHLEDIRRAGLSINAFEHRPGPWASLNWGSFLFDAGRQSLWQGYTHLEGDRPLLAAAFFRQAVDTQDMATPNHANPEIKLAAQIGLGQAFQALDLPAAAVLTYQEAIALAESLRGSLGNQISSISFAGTQAELYGRLIDVLVDLGDSDLAFAYAERARARALLDLLGNQRLDLRHAPAEIVGEWDALRRELLTLQRQEGQSRGQSESREAFRQRRLEVEQRLQVLNAEIRRLHPEAASLVDPTPLPLEHLRDLVVEDGTALMVYFSTKTQVLAWVIEAGRSHFHALPIEPSALDDIQLLRQLIAEVGEMTPGLAQEVTAQLEALYAGLIAPLKPSIAGTRLLIVPHGPLHWLPFAALRDASNERYLIEQASLTLLPSSSVLPYVQQRRDAEGSRLLILGNPDGSLDFAIDEAEAIADLYAVKPYLGAEATETIVHRLAPEVDVLHLAAHGDFRQGGALFGSIELAAGEPEGDPSADGRLQVMEVSNDLDLSSANLVVLSSCDSGVGDQSLGDDVVSMPRAFLYAGAPSVISTLWSIQDDPSAELMQRFHRLLRDGIAVDEALQQAQREILGQEGTEFPYFWAGFSLTGDPLGWGEPPALVEPPQPEPAVIRGKLRRKLRPSTSAMRAQMRVLSTRTARQPQVRRSSLATGWSPPEPEPPPSGGDALSDRAGPEQQMSAKSSTPSRLLNAQGGITLFEHGDFGGQSEAFFEDQPDLRGSTLGQDVASSVKVTPGCRAFLYRNINYQGRSTVVEGDLPSLRGSKVGNDEVSSLEIRCP